MKRSYLETLYFKNKTAEYLKSIRIIRNFVVVYKKDHKNKIF